jgi:hypothetical protein
MAKLSAFQAKTLIERTSAQLCRDHYEMGPEDGWFHGGSDHNDDRLTVKLDENPSDDDTSFSIIVTDGNQTETYSGPREDAAIRAYVHDWLRDAWAGD